jgi:hypothetical protein
MTGSIRCAGWRRRAAALRPGGVLAVWSAAPDPRFRAPDAHARASMSRKSPSARASNGKGPRHVIWFAQPA